MRRDFPLDTLRGLAVLGMLLASFLPPAILPAWMYSAQTLPPKMVFDRMQQGLNWVDLLLPIFLFTMGAAIPHALEKRLPPQNPPKSLAESNRQLFGWLSTLGFVGWRTAVLVGVAVVAEFMISRQTIEGIVLAATLIALLKYGRRWADGGVVIQILGVAIAFFMLLLAGVEPQPGALLVFAINYIVAAAIWMLVRRTPSGILAFTVIIAVLVLVRTTPGWISELWRWQPLPGVKPMDMLRYLLIVLPGVAIGQAFIEHKERGARHERLIVGIFGLLGAVIMALAIPARAFPQALFGVCVLGANALWFSGTNLRQRIVHAWGWGLCAIGVLLTGMGGVRPQPASLSYLIISAGMCCLMYAFITGLWALIGKTGQIEVREELLVELSLSEDSFAVEHGDRPGFLGLIGQNPILAYIVAFVVVPVLVEKSGLRAWREAQYWSAWTGAGFALVLAMALGSLIALVSKVGLRFRA